MPNSKPIFHTELVVAGQPKASTLKLLRQTGEHLSADRVATVVHAAEGARANFVALAIEAGLFILAKKLTLKHGQFAQFSGQLWAYAHGAKKRDDLSNAELHSYTRQLRKYAFLAQHFLADLEQSTFAPESRDQLVVPPAVTTEQVLAMVTTEEHSAEEQVTQAIAKFVAGRSLRRMITDLTRAERAGDDEEAAEAAEAAKRSRKKLPDQAEGQMDFLQDMMRPLSEVDLLMQDAGFVRRTNREFWVNLADKLEAQANKARALAKEIAK